MSVRKGVGKGEGGLAKRRRRVPGRPGRALPRAVGSGHGKHGRRPTTEEPGRGGEKEASCRHGFMDSGLYLTVSIQYSSSKGAGLVQ